MDWIVSERALMTSFCEYDNESSVSKIAEDILSIKRECAPSRMLQSCPVRIFTHAYACMQTQQVCRQISYFYKEITSSGLRA